MHLLIGEDRNKTIAERIRLFLTSCVGAEIGVVDNASRFSTVILVNSGTEPAPPGRQSEWTYQSDLVVAT